jgi:hypothetical protein
MTCAEPDKVGSQPTDLSRVAPESGSLVGPFGGLRQQRTRLWNPFAHRAVTELF